jgi:hypothetical protein
MPVSKSLMHIDLNVARRYSAHKMSERSEDGQKEDVCYNITSMACLSDINFMFLRAYFSISLNEKDWLLSTLDQVPSILL